MSSGGAVPHAPVPIGEVSAPPFARLPAPEQLFRDRAARFAALVPDHDLSAYLLFLADIATAQDRLLADLPEPEWPPAETVERAYGFGMPPLDRNRFVADAAAAAAISRLPRLLRGIAMPEAAL